MITVKMTKTPATRRKRKTELEDEDEREEHEHEEQADERAKYTTGATTTTTNTKYANAAIIRTITYYLLLSIRRILILVLKPRIGFDMHTSYHCA